MRLSPSLQFGHVIEIQSDDKDKSLSYAQRMLKKIKAEKVDAVLISNHPDQTQDCFILTDRDAKGYQILEDGLSEYKKNNPALIEGNPDVAQVIQSKFNGLIRQYCGVQGRIVRVAPNTMGPVETGLTREKLNQIMDETENSGQQESKLTV